MALSGVLLAAGSGTRFGMPKAEVRVGGQRLLDRAVATLRAGGCDEVVAVVRAGTSAAAADVVVVNGDPDRGMGSSLRLGLAAATGERAVVLLVDTPGVLPAAVDLVASARGTVAIATYDGRRGHPVAFDRQHWAEVADLAEGDRGARAFLRAHPHLVVEFPCVGDPTDLDTPAELAAWVSRQSGGDQSGVSGSR